MSLLSFLSSCTRLASHEASLFMGNTTWVASVSRKKRLGDRNISTYASCPLTCCIQHKPKPLTLNKTKYHVMAPATFLPTLQKA